MDPLFNRFVPKSNDKRFIIGPAGKTFITGLASSYDTECYDKKFFEKFNISEHDYRIMINDVNDLLISYWPCAFC
jgi:hypothetical protein